MEPHLPNYAPPEFSKKFVQHEKKRGFEDFVRQDPFDPNELQGWNEEYDALAAYLDSELRALFDGIQQRGADKNLIVIITSDHGESIGEHKLIGHRISLHPEELRVPLLIRMPGNTPEGARISEPVSLHRLASTIQALSGGNAASFDGPSLSECWQGGRCGEELILGEMSKARSPGADKHWPARQGWVKSLIAGRWHLIVQQNGNIELYDWHDDPAESKNLAESDVHREVVRRLMEKLEAWVPETKNRVLVRAE
jgi:arylsulfatase A-like enzyme